MKRFIVVLFAMVIVSTGTLGDELKGKLKDVDIFKKTITVNAAGKDTVLSVADNAKITTTGKGKNPGGDVVGGLLGLKAGGDVTVTTEKKDDKDIVTAIKLAPEAAKKKN
ncbi:hypothetical protein AYO44_15145 [Planctomycetaceae bacterium SCGC AG-212-F19]|nr:hypothetical protein AYO44_15145 [Planctomycetaceae bacterium SCGC AG-212-F19]